MDGRMTSLALGTSAQPSTSHSQWPSSLLRWVWIKLAFLNRRLEGRPDYLLMGQEN